MNTALVLTVLHHHLAALLTSSLLLVGCSSHLAAVDGQPGDVVDGATLDDAATATDGVTIWMHPGGTGDGLTPQTPAGTLTQAAATLARVAPAGPATVRMAPGTYPTVGSVTWRIPSTTFEPWAYNGGGWPAVAAAGGYPVIDGQCDGPLYILFIEAPHVSFVYIQFQNRLHGLVQPTTGGDYASFYGCFFTQVGNKYCPSGTGVGWGALIPYDTTHWSVSNSHFVDLINSFTTAEGGPAQVHGIYARHLASYGTVTDNEFSSISGDGIRVRDNSSHNTVSDNRFSHAGSLGYISDDVPPGESPSYFNAGSGNRWLGFYSYDARQRPDFCFDQKPANYACPGNRMLITGS
jgi:parallel beta-helix repeat protein